MDPVSLISEVSTESGQAHELREFAGKTQPEVAKELEKVQAEISQFENRPDHVLSKLREYIKALGGELEVVARFGDKTLRLRGV
jgi:transcriptional regulator